MAYAADFVLDDHNFELDLESAATSEPPTKANFLESLTPEKCPICYTTTIVDPIKTECNHVFCLACVEPWFKGTNTCPSCRKVVYQKPADDANAEGAEEQEDEGDIRQWMFLHKYSNGVNRETGWIVVNRVVKAVNGALGWAHIHYDEAEACELLESLDYEDWSVELRWVKVCNSQGKSGYAQSMRPEQLMRAIVKLVRRNGDNSPDGEASDSEPQTDWWDAL